MKKKGGGEKFDSLNNFIIELYYLALGDIAKAQHTAKSFQQGKKFGEDEGAHGLTVSPFPFFSYFDFCGHGVLSQEDSSYGKDWLCR